MLPNYSYIVTSSFAIVLSGMQALNAQSCSAFAAFPDVQILLTPIGVPEDEPIPPLAILPAGSTLDLSKFAPFERPQFSYPDRATPVTVTPQELQALITNACAIPAVGNGGVSATPVLSFLMAGQGNGFEAVLNSTDASALFTVLRQTLAANKPALLMLQNQACPMNLLPPGTPTNVSSAFKVTLSGVRLNRQTNTFVASATLTNTSAAAVSGPLYLLVFLSESVSLANADGSTCNTSPPSVSFVSIPGNGLSAGQSAQVTLEFANPNQKPISPTFNVLSGPGAP
jgi:hypothetical protein